MSIALSETFHVGMAVEDIDQCCKQIGEDLNLDWLPIKSFDPLPFWTPEEGLREISVKATYSRQGPQRIEIVQGTSIFYDPNRLPDSRHVGIWVDDLIQEATRLIDNGWIVLAAGDEPSAGYGTIAYLSPPFPGLMVELVSRQLEPMMNEWFTE